MTDGRSMRPFFSFRSTVRVWETIDLISVTTIARKKGGLLDQRHRFQPASTATPDAIRRVLKRHTDKTLRWIEDDEGNEELRIQTGGKK